MHILISADLERKDLHDGIIRERHAQRNVFPAGKQRLKLPPELPAHITPERDDLARVHQQKSVGIAACHLRPVREVEV